MQQPAAGPTLSKTELSNEIPYDQLGREFNFISSLKEVSFYVLPIISFVIFIAIVGFAITPSVGHIINTLSETDELITQDKALTVKENTLKTIQTNSSKLQLVIDKINQIVPTGKTSVVDFANRIKDTLNSNQIALGNLDTGEAVLATTENTASTATNPGTAPSTDTNTTDSQLNVSQIPTNFTMSGRFADFRNFFKTLYTGKDFFVVEKMNLSLTDAQDTWSGTVSLVKYQFTTSENFDPTAVYGKVSENSQPNSQVVQFLEKKFINGQL